MKKLISTWVILNVAGFAQAATVTWDGDTSTYLGLAINWSDDTAPSAANDYIVANNNGFAADSSIMRIDTGNTEYGSLTFTTGGTGTQAANLGIRAGNSFGRFVMSGDMTFSGATLTGDITLQGSTSASLSWAANGGNRNIINNTTATVTFGDANGFAFYGYNNSGRRLYFDGSGDFVLGPTVTFGTSTTATARELSGVGTAETFTGTLTIQDGALVRTGSIGLRAGGGTLKVEGTDTIIADLQVGFDGTTAVTRELNLSGLDQSGNALGALADFTSAGANNLRVDGLTILRFTDLRGAATVGINILGWSEGSSSLVFTDLGGTFYGGTVADGAAFVGLTIGGNTAYMKDLGGGFWGVTAGTVAAPEVKLWMYRTQN